MTDNSETMEMEITDRDPEEMSNEQLVEECREVHDTIFLNPGLVSEEKFERVVDQCRPLWEEMESRVDAEPPECRDCGAQQWSQRPPGPKKCVECGLELWSHPDNYQLIGEIDDYWSEVWSIAEADR